VSLQVTFVRRLGQRDRVHVTRADATTCDWSFPTYGDQLPHDLCHLVVEELLHISNGFWGLVEQGMEVRLIENQGTLVKDGRPIFEQSAFDATDLIRAEEAVALLAPIGMQVGQVGSLAVVTRLESGLAERRPMESMPRLGFSLPADATDDSIALIRERLLELQCEWALLRDGGSITLLFTRFHSCDT
jgi:hypothetical protein